MNSQYTFIENVDPARLKAFACSAPVKSHFLGSYAWGEVSKKRGWIPYYVGAEKDGKLAATALLLQKPLFLGFSYFYIPRGFIMDYSDRELLKFMTEHVHKFCKKHHSIYFKIDPDIKLQTIDYEGNVIEGGENNYQLVDDLKAMGYRQKPLNYFFENEQPRFTFRISLDDPIDVIESRYSRTTKARIKQALSAGVEVEVGEAKDIDEFTRLMAMTEKRQDFYSHDKAFYSYFYDVFHKEGMVTLYLGKLNIPKLLSMREEELKTFEEEAQKLQDATSKKAVGRKKEVDKKIAALKKQIEGLADKPKKEIVVSTYLTVKYADKAWALYAANDMDYGKFYGNYAVYQRQIRDAKAEGLKIFDVFGTIGRPHSDSRLSGLFEFKKKWGGEYTEFIGEFDYIENRPMYFMYKKLIPMYHKMVNKKLRKQVQQYEP